MIELLDRFPKEGESVVTKDGITLTAKKVEKNRIETVVLHLPAPEEPSTEEADNFDADEIK